MSVHCNACAAASTCFPRGQAICICEYFAHLDPLFRRAHTTGGERLTYQEFVALRKAGEPAVRICLDAFETDIDEVKPIFQENEEDGDDSVGKAISAQDLLCALARTKGIPRRGIWPAPDIKRATRSRLPAEDADTWHSMKDLHEYKVDNTLLHDDPDWLRHNEGHPDYENAWRSPKALRSDTLQLWRPEKLRPARPQPRAQSSTAGSSWRMAAESSCEATLLKGADASSTDMSSTMTNTWRNRTTGMSTGMSDRTLAAFGGSRDWSKTVKAKLHPLQLSKSSSSSSPLLRQQQASVTVSKDPRDRGAPRSAASLVWQTSDEAFEEKYGLGRDPGNTLFQRSITKFGYVERGDAAESLEKAIAFDPRHSLGFRQRGVMHLGARDYDAVIANCTEALRLDPTHAATWARRADAKLLKGDYKGAKADCDEAICRDVGVPRFWNTRSFVKFKMGDLEGSLKDSDRAVRLDPSVADHWSGRASCKVRLEDWEGAQEDSISAIGLDTHNLTAWVARAAARNGMHNYQGACSDCDQALLLDSLCVPALTHRGFAKVGLGDFTGGAQDCNRAIAINPNYAPAWCTRGEAKYQEAGVTDGNAGPFLDAALQDFDESLRVDPEHARAWWYRGKLFLSKGQHKTARDDIAHAYYLEPRWEEARKDYELCDKYLKTTSAWSLPLVQRGLGGDIVLQEKLKLAERRGKNLVVAKA